MTTQPSPNALIDDPYSLLLDLDRFDSLWRSLPAPSLEDYWRSVVSVDVGRSRENRLTLLRDLIRVDLDNRSRFAANPSDPESSLRVEWYLARFPEVSDPDFDLPSLIVEEFRVRRRMGERPEPEEYRLRFPSRWSKVEPLLDKVASENRESQALVSLESVGPTPRHIGRHEVVRELGRGASGVVYLARQGGLNREVAVKVIRDGVYSGLDEVGVFRREADAVSRLDHPSIVRIHEVGEHEGRPFLTLEYVSGDNLARFAAGVPQPPRRSAEIVLDLALAAAHAHGQGIVHRDLKPTNILMTADGRPKIADFGLAKFTDVQMERTRSGMMIGTAAYMAPEQARGRASEVGPSVDVYALGVILYELLSGRPPFLATNVDEVLEQVKSADPIPLRRLQPRTPRDLETICLKCLQKRPEWRYATASDLAEDLRRFLQDIPIVARPPGRVERFARWCRREPLKAAFASVASLLLLTLLIGAPVLGVLYARAESQRIKAKANLRRSLDVVDSLLTRVGEKSLEAVPQFEEARRGILLEALSFCQAFLKENADDPDVGMETARAHGRVAAIEHLLGNLANAERANIQAIALQKRLVQEHPSQAELHRDLAMSYGRLGLLHDVQGHYDQAERLFRDALDAWETVRATTPSEATAGIPERAGVLGDLGALYRRTNRPAEAERAFQEAISIEKRLKETPSAQRIEPWIAAAIHHNYGMLLDQPGRWTEAESQLLKAMDIREQLVQDHPKDPRYRYHLVQSLIGLGSVSRQTKQLDRSREFYRRAIELIGRLETDHPGVFDYALIAGLANSNYANLLRDSKDFDTALKHYAEAIRRYEAAFAVSPTHAATRQYIFLCTRGWTKTLIALGRHREAVAVWDAAERMDDGRYASQIRLFRGYSWAKLGDYRRALEYVGPLLDDIDGSLENIYQLACVYAMAIDGVRKDTSIGDSTKADLVKTCSDMALNLLAKARQADPTRFPGTKNDPDLASLQRMKEFQALYQ